MTATELDHITDAALDVAWNAIEAARAEIAALRAQLAEARADAASWENRAIHQNEVANRLAERADRAEAERAAQIDRDAGICTALEKQILSKQEGKTPEVDANLRLMALMLPDAAHEILVQPHDRSALDAMLAEARVKALREAEVAYQLAILHGRGPSAAILALAQEGGKG